MYIIIKEKSNIEDKKEHSCSYNHDLDDGLSEASTSTVHSLISNGDDNNFNEHPIKKKDENNSSFYHISCEDDYPFTYIKPLKGSNVKCHPVNTEFKYRIISNIKEQTEFLKIKLYLCRYSFIKIIRIFKYFKKNF